MTETAERAYISPVLPVAPPPSIHVEKSEGKERESAVGDPEGERIEETMKASVVSKEEEDMTNSFYSMYKRSNEDEEKGNFCTL